MNQEILKKIRKDIAIIVAKYCDGTIGDDWENTAWFLEWGEENKPGRLIDDLMKYLSESVFVEVDHK